MYVFVWDHNGIKFYSNCAILDKLRSSLLLFAQVLCMAYLDFSSDFLLFIAEKPSQNPNAGCGSYL
jgi:hypothetical protein